MEHYYVIFTFELFILIIHILANVTNNVQSTLNHITLLCMSNNVVLYSSAANYQFTSHQEHTVITCLGL